MSNHVNINTDFSLQAETLTHKARVIADGGTVIDNDRRLDVNYSLDDELGLTSDLVLACSANSGYKYSSAPNVNNLYDQSSNLRDLTWNTARPTLTTNFNNRSCIAFAGNTAKQHFRTSTFAPPNTNYLSVCFWMRAVANTNGTSAGRILDWDGQIFIGTNAPLTTGGAYSMLYNHQYGGGNQASVTSAGIVGDGSWNHWAFVYNYVAQTITVYKNGVLRVTTAMTGGTGVMSGASTIKYIGQDSSNRDFAGELEHFRIYSVPLTAIQVSRLMNQV